MLLVAPGASHFAVWRAWKFQLASITRTLCWHPTADRVLNRRQMCLVSCTQSPSLPSLWVHATQSTHMPVAKHVWVVSSTIASVCGLQVSCLQNSCFVYPHMSVSSSAVNLRTTACRRLAQLCTSHRAAARQEGTVQGAGANPTACICHQRSFVLHIRAGGSPVERAVRHACQCTGFECRQFHMLRTVLRWLATVVSIMSGNEVVDFRGKDVS